jgi:hypothetical protein
MSAKTEVGLGRATVSTIGLQVPSVLVVETVLSHKLVIGEGTPNKNNKNGKTGDV